MGDEGVPPMILSARFLDNYSDVNTFEYASQLTIYTSYPPVPGQTVTLKIQLLDMSKDKVTSGFSPAGRRYVSSGESPYPKLDVMLTSINQANNCSYRAVQSTEDKSIWTITIPESDLGKLRKGTWSMVGNLRLSASNVVRFTAPNCLNILSQDDFA
jgi:hypothetical protein